MIGRIGLIGPIRPMHPLSTIRDVWFLLPLGYFFGLLVAHRRYR